MTAHMAERAGVRELELMRVESGARRAAMDAVAVEEPLELRLSAEPYATLMRTPGHDFELTAGWLLGEGVIQSQLDIFGMSHCGRPDQEGYGNVIDVVLRPGLVLPADFAPRAPITASCGVCGRESIAQLRQRLQPSGSKATFDSALFTRLSALLSQGQQLFERTGGLHAAGVVTNEGTVTTVREDVGRHNAVDKVVGRALLDRLLPLTDCLLVVSGRVSFEIVQKAASAGLAGVAAISAPTSLAVETAQELGLLLVAFARGASFNVYAGAARLR